MQLSVIIPSFKGAEILRNNLPTLIAYLRQKNISFEIIIVDDGSGDNGATEKVAKDLGCLFFANPENMGKGAAVKNGMLKAKGDFRIFTDVDIPFELDAFDRFLKYLNEKEFDVVIGDRTLPGSSYFTEIPAIRKLGSTIFSFIVGRFVAGGHFDTQCGMKGFRATVAEDLFSVSRITGFAFDVELLYISLKRNYDIKRLPVVLRCQEGSSVSVLRHGFGMLIDLNRIKWNQLRGKYNKKNLKNA
ncbi:MAG TPA: glycosyltransferase [Bacteroidia bacterium]|nr:glycosyltransferase [Bacteroidia bacterium]